MQMPLICAAGLFLLMACGPKRNVQVEETPEFRFQAAQTAFAAGNYLGADEILEQLSRTENSHLRQARFWRVVLLAGFADAHVEIAATLTKLGQDAAVQEEIRRQQKKGAAAAFQLEQLYNEIKRRDAEGEVTLPFGFPSNVMLERPASLNHLAVAADAGRIEADVVRWAVSRSVCTAVGEPEDAVKAAAAFQGNKAIVPRAVYELAVAKGMLRAMVIHSPEYNGDPGRRETLLYLARHALSRAPTGAETDGLLAETEALGRKQ
jgi:hypothetical protein